MDNFVFKNRISLIFPRGNKLFSADSKLKEETKSMIVPLKRSSVDHGMTRKAIMRVVETWPADRQKVFHVATKNGFKSKEKVSGNTAHDKKEEVD